MNNIIIYSLNKNEYFIGFPYARSIFCVVNICVLFAYNSPDNGGHQDAIAAEVALRI